MYIYESNSGNQKVAVGTVNEINFIQKDGVDKAVIKLEDWKGEILTIWFNDKPGEAPGKQMASRVKNAKVQVGSFLAVLCLKNTEQESATGIGFQFSGIYQLTDVLPDGNETDVTIIIGAGCKPHEIKEGIYGASIPIKNKDGATDWYSISFFDNEKVKLAENAKKLFNGNRRYVCCRCGKVKENTVNGNTYKNLTAYRIEVAPKAATNTTAPATEAK